MRSWEKVSLITLVGSMLLSGSTYFVIRYGVESDDPFSVVNHPFEPIVLKIHILSGPLLIFIFGVLFRSHVQDRLRRKSASGTKAGFSTVVLFVVTGASGYLLQVVTEPRIQEVLLYTHLSAGFSFALLFVTHSLLQRYRRRSALRKLTEENRLVA